MKDDLGQSAVANDQWQTPAARRPEVGGLGDVRRPWTRRSGQEPRAKSCGWTGKSRWVGRRTTTLFEALRPELKGQVLGLNGQQSLGREIYHDLGQGALAGDQGPTPAAQSLA